MTGLSGLAVILCLLQYSDAQVTDWTMTLGTLTGSTAAATRSGTVTNAIPENTAAGTTLFSVTATGGATTGSPYTITAGNTGDVMAISNTGVVTLATGKSLNYETKNQYILAITATPATAGTVTGTATITLNIKNVLEFAQTTYAVCMAEGATAGTTVGTYTVSDNTASTTVTYGITSGNTNTAFEYTSTGVLKVATAKTLAKATTATYTVVLSATQSDSASDPGSTTVSITVDTCGCSALAATLGLTLVAMVIAVSA